MAKATKEVINATRLAGGKRLAALRATVDRNKSYGIDEAVKLGDRIAVFGTDHRLQQYATPTELLSKPANDFVVSFIGADRGLKLLAVTPIERSALIAPSSDDASSDRPRVSIDATMRDALAQMVLSHTDRIIVEETDGSIAGVLTIGSLPALGT